MENFRWLDYDIPRTEESDIFGYDGMEETVVELPCGHPVAPDEIIRYCTLKLDERNITLGCPVDPTCTQELTLDIIRRYGRANPDEMKEIEEKLTNNRIQADPTKMWCPNKMLREPNNCGLIIEKTGTSNRVSCLGCSKKGLSSEFCWQCGKPWHDQTNDQDCGNPDCVKSVLSTLKNAPLVHISHAKQCPSIRLCPMGCNTLITHDTGCNEMICPNQQCKTKFCFVCLNIAESGRLQCSNCDPHPPQTSIPKRKA